MSGELEQISDLSTVSALADADVFALDDISRVTWKANLFKIYSYILNRLNVLTSAVGSLNATYANGASGVGATLTDASGTFAAFTNDGVTYALNDRIIVADQAAPLQNGVYYLSRNGDGVSVPWQLTRYSLFNTVAQMLPGFTVTVTSGDTLASSIYVLLSPQITTIGTDDINFFSMLELAVANQPSQTLLGNPTGSTASAQPITLGTGLSFSGTTLNASAGGISNAGLNAANQFVFTSSTTAAKSTVDLTWDPVNFNLHMGNSGGVTGGGTTDAVAIGTGATASAVQSFAVGVFTQATAMNSYAFGTSAFAGAQKSMSFGYESSTSNLGSTVFADGANNGITDSAQNQWTSSYAGGYNYYVASTIATAIDVNYNFINKKGVADQSYSYQTPSTGFSITIGAGVKSLSLVPAGTLATGTVVMPASPIDGQIINVSTSQTITALTVSGNSGQTILNAPTTLAAGQGFSFKYNLANTQWLAEYQPSSGGAATPAPNNNVIIPGDFNVNPFQYASSITNVTNTFAVADMFYMYKSGSTGHMNSARFSDPLTDTSAGYYSPFCLRMLVTATQSVTTGTLYALKYCAEGNDFAPLTNQPMTLSFWVKSTLTGTFCVSFVSGAADASYVAEYTINSANTWEKKTITITHSNATGTWTTTAGTTGLKIYFTMTAGATYQTTAGSWQAGEFAATSNQTQMITTNSSSIKFNLVKLEQGSTATSFTIDSESDVLSKCQRYYEKSYDTGVNEGAADTTGSVFLGISGNTSVTPQTYYVPVPFKVRKALAGASLTTAIYSAANGTPGFVTQSDGSDDPASVIYPGQTGMVVTGTNSLTSNYGANFHYAIQGYLT